jgi:hypothetical protein
MVLISGGLIREYDFTVRHARGKTIQEPLSAGVKDPLNEEVYDSNYAFYLA